LTTAKIADIFKVNPSTVVRALKKSNIKRRTSHDYKEPRPRKLFPKDKDTIISLL